jgi:type I restriction enzyme S subunit
MVVKRGYKQTEVGVIPEDWEIKSISDLNFDISDGNYSSKYPKASDFRIIGIPFIRANNIRNMKVVDDELRYISEEQHSELLKGHLKKNDILITTRGEIGQIALVPDRHIGSNINAQLVRINVDKLKYDHRYIAFILAFDSTQKQFDNLQTGSALKQLPVGKFTSLKLPLPPTKAEQQAIAEALSDVDGLISALDALIAKQRAIKQGAMQELLTGQRRLPGFAGEWEVKKLGECGDFKNGINKGKEDFGVGHPFVNLLDIFGISRVSQSSSLGLINSTESERAAYSLNKGDILFVRSSVKPEGVGLTSLVCNDLKDTVYSGFLIRFRDYGKLSFEYKEYCFYEKNFRRKLIDSSTVSANTNINQNSLKNLEILLPPTLAEQTAIAQILADMDDAIAALVQKRAKTVALKQGMMQALLTGQVRLV